MQAFKYLHLSDLEFEFQGHSSQNKSCSWIRIYDSLLVSNIYHMSIVRCLVVMHLKDTPPHPGGEGGGVIKSE